jgi:hypothetical protein
VSRAGSPFTSLGMGHLWMLDAGGEGPGALSFLFTEQPVTLDQWPAWARMPQTWRVRKLGEGMDLETAEELNRQSAIEKAERKLARLARWHVMGVMRTTAQDVFWAAAERLRLVQRVGPNQLLSNEEIEAVRQDARRAIDKALADNDNDSEGEETT